MKLPGRSLIVAAALVAGFLIHPFVSTAEEKWQGVDKTVVQKFAKEQGREAKESLINTDQGDLLLFVFLLAGALGGFAAGYYWRVLTERKTRDRE
jgi:ABC-type cobalt transport system substrate-binding protein